MSYVLDFSINPFTKKKQPEYYYDFGTGVKIPVENKKDSTQTTPTQNTKSTYQDEDTDAFLEGFNYDRDERDSRVRNAYAERVKKNKVEREMRTDAFLEGLYGADDVEEKEPRNATFKDMTINSAKKGYFNDRYGEELFKQMNGQKNEAEKYKKILEGEEYNFKNDSFIGENISDAFSTVGEFWNTVNDKETLAAMLTGAIAKGGSTFTAGQLGPQAAFPEEVLTVPSAAVVGAVQGYNLMDVPKDYRVAVGHTYNDMIREGVSPNVASKVALGTEAISTIIGLIPTDEIIKAFGVLDKTGKSADLKEKLKEELLSRGVEWVKGKTQDYVKDKGFEYAKRQ